MGSLHGWIQSLPGWQVWHAQGQHATTVDHPVAWDPAQGLALHYSSSSQDWKSEHHCTRAYQLISKPLITESKSYLSWIFPSLNVIKCKQRKLLLFVTYFLVHCRILGVDILADVMLAKPVNFTCVWFIDFQKALTQKCINSKTDLSSYDFPLLFEIQFRKLKLAIAFNWFS